MISSLSIERYYCNMLHVTCYMLHFLNCRIVTRHFVTRHFKVVSKIHDGKSL